MSQNPEPSKVFERRLRRALTWLSIFASAFAIGYNVSGQTTTQRVTGGLWALGIFLVVFAAIYLVLLVIVRMRLGPLYRPIKQTQRQLAAMNDDQLRTAAITAIETTTYFRAVPATQPPEPGWPQDVADFFSVYDSVEFVLPGTTAPYLCLCRTFVGNIEGNPGLLKIGEWYPAGSYIAVCRSTGRVVSWHCVTNAPTTKRLLVNDQLSQRSIWHYIALVAAQQRVADFVNKPVYLRSPKLDTRPAWRSEGPSSPT